MSLKSTLTKLGLYNGLIKAKTRVDLVRHSFREKRYGRLRVKFYSGFLQPGNLVFDVGANIGNRVKSFLEIGCRVVAIEPQESCYEILEKKFGSRIEIVKMGVGEADDEKIMYVANESTISTLSTEFIEKVKEERFKRYEWNKQITIRITTLDAIIRQFGMPVFCKIDVEGYELEVLKGLSHPVQYMSLEYTVPEQTDRLIKCIERCLELDPAYTFNYSIGESMVFALPQFVSSSEFLKLIQTRQFQESSFGDIYLKR